MDEVFKNNPSLDSMIIKKTYASSSGKKIFRLERDQIRTDPEHYKGNLF